jgi:phosphatidylglycerophosphate synthase
VTIAHRPELQRALKPVDSWWTVIAVDPVAMRVLPPLLRRPWVTPNGITACAFVVGAISVGLFATGQLVAGALVYELRFFLDCLDGKLARVRRTSSSFGAAFDRLADALTVPAAYAALGWTLATQGTWSHTFVLAVAFMATLVTVCELSLEAARRGAAPQPDAAASSGAIGWARSRRLTLRPWTVEAEALGLFLGPLLLRGHALAELQLAVGGIYALFVVVDVVLMARTTAA